MIRGIVFGIVLCLFVKTVAAQEQDWAAVYEQITRACVCETSAEKLGVAALKALNGIDKDLRVGNDLSRLTLYYKGKVAKVLRKPKDNNDFEGWGLLTQKMIEAAVATSPAALEKDFLIEDEAAENMIAVLDEDSKYYRSFDAEETGRNHRVFAVRKQGQGMYVKILAFNKQTAADLKDALADYAGVENIIIDLRGCGGGMAGAAVEAADLFLNDGIILSTKGKNTLDETYYVAKADDGGVNIPIYLFVDENTASAAEIFAAALQEQGRAKVIGTLSKGKGTMQKLIGLAGGGVVAVTNRFVMTPSGRELNKAGVVPDICTFEKSEEADVKALIGRKKSVCARQSREDTVLEFKVVETLLKTNSPATVPLQED